jgi:hypothetical protein
MIGQPEPDLASYGHLLVRRAILRDDWISEAILELAAGDKLEWTVPEWDTLTAELAGCDLTIEDWLIYYT